MRNPSITLLCVGCLLLAATAAPAQWCEEDVVSAWAEGSTIVVLHQNAEWNCCTAIGFELEQNANVFDLYESELGPFCYCICCFDLVATIVDVVPGDYVIRVLDAVSGEILGQTEVTVEGDVAPVLARLGETAQSPCGGFPSAVPDGSEESRVDAASWGLIRSLYR